jgi:hypothetical protein
MTLILENYLNTLDCRSIVIRSGIDYKLVRADGSLFIDCFYCDMDNCSSPNEKCMRVTKDGFYCFKSEKRGGFKDLLLICLEHDKTGIVIHAKRAIWDYDRGDLTFGELVSRIDFFRHLGN